MAYNAYNSSYPDGTTRTGVQTATDIRNNLQAIRDMIVGDFAIGWNYSQVIGSGSAEEPDKVKWTNGSNIVQADLTWGGGKVTQSTYQYSSNGGSSYDQIGVLTPSYDSNGNVFMTAWS